MRKRFAVTLTNRLQACIIYLYRCIYNIYTSQFETILTIIKTTGVFKMKQKNRSSLIYLTQAGVIGGAYAALCLLFPGISYGPIQVRVAEVLTVLPVFFPAAIPGLTVGCLLANLVSSAGAWDWLFGTLATLAAAGCSYALRGVRWHGLPLLATLPPVLINAVVVGAQLAVLSGSFAWPLFWLYAAQVAAGQLVACTVGGTLLAAAISRRALQNGNSGHCPKI